MKVYNVEPNQLTGDKPIQITRDEIDSIKRKTKAGGYEAYSMMLDILSSPFAIARVCLVPGTHGLRWILNGCILVGKLIIPAIIIFLILRLWVWAIVAAVVGYIAVFRIQTGINHEIGARLFVLDQNLDMDNLAGLADQPYDATGEL